MSYRHEWVFFHILRRGSATCASAAGCSDNEMCTIGNWVSSRYRGFIVHPPTNYITFQKKFCKQSTWSRLVSFPLTFFTWFLCLALLWPWWCDVYKYHYNYFIIICMFAFVTICLRFCIVSASCIFACISFLYQTPPLDATTVF